MTFLPPRPVTLTLVALLILGGCGAARPDLDDLSSALVRPSSIAPTTPEKADCTAQVLLDSDVSDETLAAIVEGDADYSGTTEEQSRLTQALTDAQARCV